jgi:hypothetical protein
MMAQIEKTEAEIRQEMRIQQGGFGGALFYVPTEKEVIEQEAIRQSLAQVGPEIAAEDKAIKG